jgi:hypothetical protein
MGENCPTSRRNYVYEDLDEQKTFLLKTTNKVTRRNLSTARTIAFENAPSMD